MASAKDFFSENDKDAIVKAIRKVELSTSGEIRVHVDEKCEEDVYEKAIKVFHFLKMEKTPFRNAVLIYIALKDRKFAIVGDEAIHNKVDDAFWKDISEQLRADFKKGDYGYGVNRAIETIGETLFKYFPHMEDLDTNKLPDDISFE
ncbi:MAG: hypothetical protein JWN78_2421 [Bacteroidota bacterium]|nr:hypothetical protein [Bacteroidota bacterium]